jgi:hypothetical protein
MKDCKISSILCILYALYNVIFGIILLIYHNSIAAMSNGEIQNNVANALLSMGEAIVALLLFVTGIIMCGIAVIFLVCGMTGLIVVKHKSLKGAFINAIFKAVLSCIGVINHLSAIISSMAEDIRHIGIEWQTLISIFILAAILILSIKEIVNYMKIKRK